MRTYRACGAWLVLGLIAISGWMPRAATAQADKDEYGPLILTIQQRIEQHDLQAARSMIVAAQGKYPANAGLENLLGVVAIQQGQREPAIRQFSAALLHDPGLTSAYLNLGRVYSENARGDVSARNAALRVYQRLLQREPGNAEANYQAALLYMWAHNYEQALQHLARLSPEDRRQVGALVVACSAEAAMHHSEAADKAADALAAAPDLGEQDVLELLPALREARRADLIERLLLAAEEKHPLSGEGLRVLGLAQEGEGKLGLARQTLERAYASGKNPAAVLVDLTRVARAEKDDRAALGYLAHARDLEPQNAGFAYEFGVISLHMGLLGESRKAMAEAVRLEPGNADFNYGMGVVSSFAQDATQGLPYLEKYHRLRPSDPAALLAMGTMWFRAKNYDAARTWLRQAATHPVTAADAYYYLGRIDRVTGHEAEAKSELERANALAPDHAGVLAELGQVATAGHDYPRAQALLERALERDPKNYQANFALLQLYARTNDPRLEAQSKRFDEVKANDEESFREMMRTVELRPENAAGN